jgi:hypothetical protein
MLSRIEHHSPVNLATPERGQATPKSSQAFSDLLAGESAGELKGERQTSGIARSGLEVPSDHSGQIPVAARASRQVLDTPDSATESSFNPLAIFEPKPVEGGSATQPAAPRESAGTTSAPFIPEFQQNLEVVSAYGGSSPLNPIYFATPETAQWIANQFGTGEVVARPYNATGGPYTANGTEYYIRLKNGGLVNAGLLADYYQRMPAAEADSLIRQGLSEA